MPLIPIECKGDGEEGKDQMDVSWLALQVGLPKLATAELHTMVRGAQVT